MNDRVYVVEEITSWEDGTFTGHSEIAYQSPNDAFDAIFKRVGPDKKDRRNVKWRFNMNDGFKARGFADVEIVGEGEFASIRDEDLGEFLPGKRTIRMKELWLKEAKE